MSEAEKKIRRYLASSAGCGNELTTHVRSCFVGMVESSEATLDDFERAGGDYVRDIVERDLNAGVIAK